MNVAGLGAKQQAIGLVGAGRWGRNILRDLVALGAEVHAADPDEAARAEAEILGAASTVSDLQALPSVDGYVVAAATSQHFPILKRLADTGKPVFIEKPMVTGLAEALEIQALMGGRVFVMHKWRYHPGIEALAGLVGDGRFGRLVALKTRRMQGTHHHADMDAFWTLMPHDVSVALHILGRLPECLSVAAEVDAGAILAMKADLGPVPQVCLEISTIYDRTERRVTATFERAEVTLEDPMADHLVVSGEGMAGKLPIATEMPLRRELAAFLAYLRGGAAPFSSIADELSVMERLDEMRALALGQRPRQPQSEEDS